MPADDLSPVLEALKHAVAGRGTDPGRRQREATERRERITRDLLDRLDPVRRRMARATLRHAQEWAPRREDALAAMGLAWPTLRRLLLDLGGWLARAGAIAHAEDVFWLTEAEVDRPPRRSTPGRRASPTTARQSNGGAGMAGTPGSRRPRSTCQSRAG
ncbi:MAG: hypothetical protein R2719_00750 [Micropruina sp.]